MVDTDQGPVGAVAGNVQQQEGSRKAAPLCSPAHRRAPLTTRFHLHVFAWMFFSMQTAAWTGSTAKWRAGSGMCWRRW